MESSLFIQKSAGNSLKRAQIESNLTKITQKMPKISTKTPLSWSKLVKKQLKLPLIVENGHKITSNSLKNGSRRPFYAFWSTNIEITNFAKSRKVRERYVEIEKNKLIRYLDLTQEKGPISSQFENKMMYLVFFYRLLTLG